MSQNYSEKFCVPFWEARLAMSDRVIKQKRNKQISTGKSRNLVWLQQVSQKIKRELSSSLLPSWNEPHEPGCGNVDRQTKTP